MFLLGSSLQLMEDLAARRAAVGHILPILNDLLDPTKHSYQEKDMAGLERLRAWVKTQEEENEREKRFQDAVTSGWLRKLDSHKITSRTRWCVIDGGRMMYYEDRAETRLKGVLQLRGCRCAVSSNALSLSLGLGRGYHFEITAGDGGSTFNPMHAGKKVYRFVTTSADARRMWVDAIRAASGRLDSDAPALEWRRRLSESEDAVGYRSALRRMMTAPRIEVSADWVRLQMAGADRGMASSDGPTDSLVSERKAAVKAAEVSTERRAAGHTPGDRVSMSQLDKDVQRDMVDVDGLALRGPEAGVLIAALAKRIGAAVQGVGDERWVPVERRDTERSFESAVLGFAREVLLCSSRTVTGGDAYDAVELVFRNPDCVHICPDMGDETEPVEITISEWDEGSHSHGFSSPASTPGSGSGRSRTDDDIRASVVSATKSGAETMNPLDVVGVDSLEPGMDTSDGDSVSGGGTTTRIRRTNSASTGRNMFRRFAAGSVALAKASVNGTVAVAKASVSGTVAVAKASAKGSVRLAKVLTLQGGSSSPRGRSRTDSDMDFAMPSRPAPAEVVSYKDAAARPGRNICVTVSAKMKYRLIPANPTRNNEPPVGMLLATFTRRFPWRGCPLPAEVSLSVLSVAEEDGE